MGAARRLAPIAALVVPALVAVSGCTPVACTDIGSDPGIAVVVGSELAPTLSRLTLDVCAGVNCRTVPVVLSPGSTTRGDDCPSTSPDSACSATVVPDGTLTGFAKVTGLPTATLQVGATAIIDGAQRRFDRIGVTATATYPNGNQCPAGGNQASVEVRESGLVGR
jgi:hypothetical protein